MIDPDRTFLPSTELEMQVSDIVSRLTYADDWLFEMMRSGDRCFVRITWAVRDLDPQPRPLFDFQSQYGSPRGYRSGWTWLTTSVSVSDLELVGEHWTAVFLESLWAAIAELEGHERLERLRVDGIPVWTPHPPGEQQIAPGRVRSSPAGLTHSVRVVALPSRP